MKCTIRSQSQLLPRRSYKPNWRFKSGPRDRGLTFRPARAGPSKINLNNYECDQY
jgi:hypothetical protein